MSSERNLLTQKGLSSEIKAVKEYCEQEINILVNAPPEVEISPENATEKALAYVEGLRSEIENSNIPITTDENLLTSQFLSDLDERIAQMKEMAAFMQGSIRDTDVEICRFTEQIKLSQEARSRPQQRLQVNKEHIHKAKQRFQLIKRDLQGLIHSLFPDNAVALMELLGILMSDDLKASNNGYLPITTENYDLIELLKQSNIVCLNPYNNAEVRLAHP